jgi:hypothetical protein
MNSPSVLPLGIGIILPFVVARRLADFTFTGSVLLAAQLQASVFGLLWGLWVIDTATVGSVTRSLMLLGYPLVALSVVVGFLQSVEQWARLLGRAGQWFPGGRVQRLAVDVVEGPCSVGIDVEHREVGESYH